MSGRNRRSSRTCRGFGEGGVRIVPPVSTSGCWVAEQPDVVLPLTPRERRLLGLSKSTKSGDRYETED